MTTETTDGQMTRPTATSEAPRTAPIRRSRSDRVLAGVCGGIAASYGADPTAVRLLAAIIGVLTGIVPMLVLYLIAAVVIPEATDEDRPSGSVVHRRIEPGRGTLIIGALLIIIGVAALANEVYGIDWDVVWPIALIGFGSALLMTTLRR
jgi:phage shock protein PspC (stress-responsive transcriptional regulator)